MSTDVGPSSSLAWALCRGFVCVLVLDFVGGRTAAPCFQLSRDLGKLWKGVGKI